MGTTRSAFAIEKWYLDTIFPDGTLLVVLLAELRLLGRAWAALTAELHGVDGTVRRGVIRLPALARDRDAVTFAGGALGADALSFRTPTLWGTLRFAPRARPAALRDPLLRRGRHHLRWIVEIPDADVAGEVGWPGGGCAVAGRGYRDYLATDLPPWRLAFRELRWGRALIGPDATCWISLRGRGVDACGTWRHGLFQGDLDVPDLADEEVLLDAPVATLPLLRIGAAGTLLRVLARDPRQRRLRARARRGDAAGWAVHEVVRWR